MRKGKAENELGANDEDLWRKTATINYDFTVSTHLCMCSKTERTFGVRPLNRAAGPSCLIRSLTTVTPESLVSKFWFWMRVLTVSRGAAMVIDATAPATDAIKFWVQVALEKSLMPRTYSFVAAEAPKSCTGVDRLLVQRSRRRKKAGCVLRSYLGHFAP